MDQAATVTTDTPFHRGERAVQERLGVADQVADLGRRVIRDHMPDQHRDFYAALPFVPARQDFDADLAVEGAALHSLYCESCHPKGGSEAGYADRLAGQWTPYLRRTIGQISQSELAAPHMMERKLGDFSEKEIESLLNFWASQQGD